MKEIIVGRNTCDFCGGSGELPIVDSVDPPRVGGSAPCVCAVQLMWDGRTLWVNGSDGGSIARFGPAGIDIHRPALEQLEGKNQCLDCVPAAGYEDVFSGKQGRDHPLWPEFESKLVQHYGIVIPEGFMEG